MKRITLSTMVLLASVATSTAAMPMTVYLAEGCECCHGWIKHMEKAGYEIRSRELPYEALQERKTLLGIPDEAASCHTALVEGYSIEGHVPAKYVERLLEERPDAVGLAAPGMPLGSPGMGTVVEEPYDIVLIRRDGSIEVFATVTE